MMKLPVWHSIGLALKSHKGMKWPFWLTFLCGMVLLAIVSSVYNALIEHVHPGGLSVLLHVVAILLQYFIWAGFMAGLVMISIRRLRGDVQFPVLSGFKYFDRYWQTFSILIAIDIIMLIVVGIPLLIAATALGFESNIVAVIFFALGILLYIFIMCFFPMIMCSAIELRVWPLKAIAAGAKLVWPQFWRVLGYLVSVFILTQIYLWALIGIGWAFIALATASHSTALNILAIVVIVLECITLIWAAPIFFNAVNGVLYTQLQAVQQARVKTDA